MRSSLAEAGIPSHRARPVASRCSQRPSGAAETRSGRASFAATTASCRSRTRASTRSSTCSRRSATSSATRTWASSASFGEFCDPARALIVETAHRDAFARFARPNAHASLGSPSGRLAVPRGATRPTGPPERSSTYRLIVTPEGERIERRFIHRVYSVKEWMRDAARGGLRRRARLSARGTATRRSTPDAWRLILRAR